MKEWQKREKHATDIRRILKETGCINNKGMIQSWKGPVVFPKLEQAGHSAMSFDDCKCCKD